MTPPEGDGEERTDLMWDVVMVGLCVVFFIACLAYVSACERL